MENSWFPVMEVWAQQQLRSAVASKGFHCWWQRHLVWVTRTTGMAGLSVTMASHWETLCPSISPLLIWKSACVVHEQQAQGHTQGKGHCRVLIPFSEKEPSFWNRSHPRNADSQNMHTVLFKVQEGRRQISCIFFFLFFQSSGVRVQC